MGEADEPLLAVKRGRPQAHQLLVYFQVERNWGRAWSRATARAEEPIISLRGLGTVRCARLQPDLAATRESTAVNSGSDSAGHAVRRHSRITGEPHRKAAAGGVKGPWGLARQKGSHYNPQIAQSTSRWFSAHGREASAGRDRGSPSHPREEREGRSQRCHGYTLRTNA